jgi:hypothetical protein
MKVNQEKLMEDLISRGIDSGFSKSYTNNSNPSSLDIKKNVFNEVMSEIKNYFVFESLRTTYPANVAGSKEFNKMNEIDKRGGDGC